MHMKMVIKMLSANTGLQEMHLDAFAHSCGIKHLHSQQWPKKQNEVYTDDGNPLRDLQKDRRNK